MPYIKADKRPAIIEGDVSIQTPGELNYVLSEICLQYIADRGDLRYYTINEVIGALECCKLEFYRRLVVPYEDASILKNGDLEGYKDGMATETAEAT